MELLKDVDIHTIARRLIEIIQEEQAPVILLEGPLGAGKTYLVKQILKHWDVHDVSSPSFVILKEYSGKEGTLFAHIDFYRLLQKDNFLSNEVLEEIGFWDYVGSAPMFVEWPSNLEELITSLTIPLYKVTIRVNNGKRLYTLRQLK